MWDKLVDKPNTLNWQRLGTAVEIDKIPSSTEDVLLSRCGSFPYWHVHVPRAVDVKFSSLLSENKENRQLPLSIEFVSNSISLFIFFFFIKPRYKFDAGFMAWMFLQQKPISPWKITMQNNCSPIRGTLFCLVSHVFALLHSHGVCECLLSPSSHVDTIEVEYICGPVTPF